MKMVQISDLNGDRIQAFGKILFISRDEEGELCFRLNSKEIHFLDEIRESGKVLTADLESRVDQNICDVIVTGAKTAQKTEESVITVDRILFCIEQSCLMCDIVSQLRAFSMTTTLPSEDSTASFARLMSFFVLPEPFLPIISVTIVFASLIIVFQQIGNTSITNFTIKQQRCQCILSFC